MLDPLSVIESHMAEFQRLGARRIGVFGSFALGTATDASDVDVYMEFEEGKRTYDNFYEIHNLLESSIGRRVDLVTDKALTEGKARLILPTVRYASFHG
jgi:predicted nucleotidyltransferase